MLIKEGSVFCIALNEKAYLFPCLSWLDKPYLLPSCHHSCSTLKQASVSGFPGCSRCCSTVSVARGLPLRETIDRWTLLVETSPYPWEEWNISRRGGNKRELLAWLGSLLILRIEPQRPLDGRSFILCWLPHRMNLLPSWHPQDQQRGVCRTRATSLTGILYEHHQALPVKSKTSNWLFSLYEKVE